MKTQNIYQVVIVRGDEIKIKYDVFCLSLEKLYENIGGIIRDHERDGYSVEDYPLHKWDERVDRYGEWHTVNHVKVMTRVDDFGIDKKAVGFITFQAE